MKSADLSADRRPTIGRSSADCQNPKTVGRWKNNYNKVVIILFLSADEKRAKIWHFIGRSSADKSADGRPTVGGVNVIAVLQYTRYFAYSDALKNSFNPRTIPLWNSLPSSVVSSKTIEEFKGLI